MKYGILGSGFGIYGWLLAVFHDNAKNKVITLEKYKSKILSRIELKKCLKIIIFVKNEDEIIKKSRTIIIAKRPRDQEFLLKKIIKNKNKKLLILEKPLARTPKRSISLLKTLKKNKLNFKFSLPFQKTNWNLKLTRQIKEKNFKGVNIIWNFKSKFNKKRNWKNNTKEGGGILRFYFIHFFYFISSLGKKIKIREYILRKNIFSISFEVDKKKVINFFINKNSKEKFSIFIKNKKNCNYNYVNPFEKKQLEKKEDIRVKYLMMILKDKKNYYKNIFKGTKLWDETEKLISSNL